MIEDVANYAKSEEIGKARQREMDKKATVFLMSGVPSRSKMYGTPTITKLIFY